MIKIYAVLCVLLPLILGVPIADEDHEFLQTLDAESSGIGPDPTELAQQAGYLAETHEVVTEDRYILTMNRIRSFHGNNTSNNMTPVLILHGLLDCAASWVLSEPSKSLALILADKGYDVWLGNSRGNRYSRRHLDWTPSEKEFWAFSWHEIGMYDIPAMIDHIVMETKKPKIFYAGHSQGGTSFFVMASERPQYQEKLIAAFNMAPAVFMKRASHIIIQMLAPIANSVKLVGDLIGLYEFKPTSYLIQTVAQMVCDEDNMLQPICKNIFLLMNGRLRSDLNTTLIPYITQYDPAGASTKQFVHYAQLVNSGKFQKYDYGVAGNLINYGNIHPPDYKLGNIQIPVYLHYSKNDAMVAVKDLEDLYNVLPNAQKFLVPIDDFVHTDFIFGKHVHTCVYSKILNLMELHKN